MKYSLRHSVRWALGLALAGVMVSLPLRAIGQQNDKKAGRVVVNPSPSIPSPGEKSLGIQPLRGLDGGPEMWMQVALDWTHCQIHRSGDYSFIELILPGYLSTWYAMKWQLNAIDPMAGGAPKLYFIEDVMGMSGSNPIWDIPLNWEISLNGGAFVPMALLPDNSLGFTFPPGTHNFEVRITGDLQPFQEDGYYFLKLSQNIVPEL